MCNVNRQDNQKRPISVYVLIAAVVILDLSLVYFVNVEVLPLIFDIDRELYRQSLINIVIQITTTALGVFLGLSLFHTLGWPLQKPDRDELQKDVPTQEIEQVEGAGCFHSKRCEE